MVPASLKGNIGNGTIPEPATLPSLPAATTLFLPVSGNPIGFNHFALAEWLLRRSPRYERVVFVLSNGRHPDPTKADADVSAGDRYALAQAAIAAIANPTLSFLARQAELAGEKLAIHPECLFLDGREFTVKSPVRTYQLVQMLRESGVTLTAPDEPLHWAVGADLVRRMADPAIFSDADVQFLAQRLDYAILDREGDPARAAVELLRQRRGVMLNFKVFDLGDVPAWLAPFLQLSSTLIRHCAQAGDPLGGMLPLPAAEYIASHGLYKKGQSVARLMTSAGLVIGEHTALQLALEGLQSQLDTEASAVANLLWQRHAEY
jgi:nicotinic acid mononucleotide adenylyltransferase